MGYQSGFRKPGWLRLPESVREEFWEAVRSGLSPTAAATVTGVHGSTGRKWAKDAGYVTDTKHRGIRYSPAVRDAFWEAVRSGCSPAQAAVMSGVSEHTGRHWLKQAGFVPRTPAPADHELDTEPRVRSMSFTERCRLEELLVAGCSPARAAGLLGCRRSTISRETRRGATGSGYRARVGQDAADVHAARPKPRKLDTSPALLDEVLRRLEKRHSPEQIAGRLRQDFPDDPEMWVSHETIYQAVYVQPRGELAQQVKTALRSGRTRRKPQGRKPIDGRGRMKDMVNISATNVVGMDDDLGYGVLRVTRDQQWRLSNLPQPLRNMLLAIMFEWGIALLLGAQPSGAALLIVAGLGIITYGLYSFAMARYTKM